MAGKKSYRKRTIQVYVRPTTYRRNSKIIHRKGYRYRRVDLGKPGKGEKVLPPLKEGGLKNYLPKKYQNKKFYDLPAKVRRKALRKCVEEEGYRTALGRVHALVVLNKRTNPELAEKAEADREWLVKTFGKE